MNSYKIVELFSGAGLMGGGFKESGFQSIFAAELDPRAVSTYNYNIEPVAEVWDANIVKEDLEYDVLVAGPPCQGFSTLGRRDPKDKRNSLSLCVYKWAEKHTPKVVLIENVPQFLDSKYFTQLKKKFSKLGYTCVTWTLNSEHYGVAQKRIRSFTIFSTIGLPNKPEESEVRLTLRDAFHGLSDKATGSDYHISPEPTDIALARMKLIPPLGDKRDILSKAPELCPPSWFKIGNQAVDVWGRMDWERPANTLRCSFQSASKGRYIHPCENRVISLREGARIQGIPDTWIFSGDRTAIARQIGNGVPVPLASAVAKSIMHLLISS
ncbi:DNA cytosine methyltransferase [Chromobacterium piscinae]|uniref:DNA cytosine methyltransferase n=1 Tax=Chromobacterium TaxID=535 RepID=UPI001B325799|nr:MULTISPECIES: DNA cytosine methyltransferase [Chromobacterium]MBP4046272.1 DNA cytosine methyltransferase [Chromobacterium violaceum]MCD4506752.1 DNA cytosine methyltransferase [Chromobacterium piscinae]